jgi:hypothetical protein
MSTTLKGGDQRMKNHRALLEIKLVIFWIMAMAAGASLALLLGQILLLAIDNVVWLPADAVFIAGMLGLFLGIGQWLLLRPRLPRSGWWVFASLIGGIIAGFVVNQIGNQAISLALFGTFGLILGAFQWSVLRGRLRNSGIWPFVSGFAWALGSLSIDWVDRIALHPSWPFNELLTVATMYALLGVLVGVVTGAALAWMLHSTPAPYHPSRNQLLA